MKKNLVVTGFALTAMLFVAGAALSIHNAMAVHAEDASDTEVQSAILGYINESKTYTKKTQIFLNEEARVDMVDVFHAKHNVLERTTYYDETTNALLMGDYDGGFDHINSGYRYDSEAGNMKHYSYTGDNSSTADYFTAVHDDYSVKDTSPNEYFVNLSQIAGEVLGKTWTKDGNGAFYHDFTTSESTDPIPMDEHGNYTDTFLKTIQYFAAPMLLQDNHYFTPRYVQIRTCTDWLSIRLYVSPGSNGSLTVYDDYNGLLAEARVFRGLVAQETSRWVVKGSWAEHWDVPVTMKYYATIRETEQYCLTQQFAAWTAFKVVDIERDYWYGMDNVDSSLKPFLSNDGGNIKLGATRTYSLFWKASEESLWINVEDITFTLNVEAAWYGDATQFGIYSFCKGYTDKDVWNPTYTEWPGNLVAAATTQTLTISGFSNLLTINVPGTSTQTADLDISVAFSSVTISKVEDAWVATVA